MSGIVARAARDFLRADSEGRRTLLADGDRAIVLAAEIAARLGTLRVELDDLLRLCIVLERAQSLDAALAIERAIAKVGSVRTVLGLRGESDLVPHLRRRRLRLLNQPRAGGQFQVREVLVKSPPRQAKRYANRV